MSRRDLANLLGRIAAGVEGHVDTFAAEVSRRLGSRDRIEVVAYRGFGSSQRVFVTGRVLEHAGVVQHAKETALGNFLNTIRRLESDEIAGARLRLTIGEVTREATTNAEGYFAEWIDLPQALAGHRLWHEYHVDLLAPLRDGTAPRATGHVMVAAPAATLAVISDLDDTVVQTNSGDLVAMARTVLLGSARSRLPFPGVASFYQALHHGVRGAERNPLFYVSSSPWNLYDLLHEFLDLQGIPMGPLLLRDWGLSGDPRQDVGHAGFKLEQIRRLIDVHPSLPFILLGDSGQEDPEIYRTVVAEYPGRIAAIYIRAVSRRAMRDAAVRALADEVRSQGSTMMLVSDTLAAASHAAASGWIADAAVERVAQHVRGG